MDDIDPRYPLGPFAADPEVTPEKRRGWIHEIAAAPDQLRAAVAGLDRDQLDTPYRDGGWTVRQVIHHLPDSHLNAYVRFKLALTEDVPTIRPYDEKRWAELADSAATPVETSLTLLDALHQRWVVLLRAMRETDFERLLDHPEMGRRLSLDVMLQLYAWHGRHHIAHITHLRRRLERD